MSSHFDGDHVEESSLRTRDGGVIVGFNDGFDPIDNLFAPTSYEVLIFPLKALNRCIGDHTLAVSPRLP
jgi:hypothetical protein